MRGGPAFVGLFLFLQKQQKTMKKLSLHLGLNAVNPGKYGGWPGTLNACEQDAKDMQALCLQKGFLDSKLLLTRDATFSALQLNTQRLAAQTESGDLVVITYSGHGGQYQDDTSDEKDGLDETICLYDTQVVDDVIRALIAQFAKGVRVVTIFDSCHSGTAARLVASAPNGLGAVKCAPRSATQAQRPVFAPTIPLLCNHLHIGACADAQVSYDGDKNGFFTARLLQSVTELGQNATWEAVYKNTKKLCGRTQTPQMAQFGKTFKGWNKQPIL